MSSRKRLSILILAALALFVVLYLVANQLIGPGIRDYSDSIINGYEYSDAGGYEKTIVYTGAERRKEIVIDAMVDQYRVVGSKLFVARRPREIFQTDGVTKSRLLDKCEYWVIDIENHQVGQTSDSNSVVCH